LGQPGKWCRQLQREREREREREAEGVRDWEEGHAEVRDREKNK